MSDDMADRQATPPPVLLVDDMSKTFVGQRALDRVDIDVRPAEVHAIIGHNGSGKSTLIKILAGYHLPDPGSGAVVVGGDPLRPGDPDASRRAGLRFIHQELGLVDSLTVLENLRLGGEYETGALGQIRWRRERRRSRELLARVGLSVHPEIVVSELSPVQRTQLAVARALQDDGARVVFFDEPTANLPGSEVERLFDVIRRLTADGVGVAYVSHRLEELPVIADRISVLRDGRITGTGPASEFSRERLVELIVGSSRPAVADVDVDVEAPSGPEAADAGPVATLGFENVAAGELVDATLSVRGGEIVGLAGLAGSGVHDLAAMLLGKLERRAGRVLVDGEPMERIDPHQLMLRHIAVLPSSRALKSIPTLTVRENLTLPDLRPLWRGGRLRRREEVAVATELIERFGVRPADPERPLAELSGGNQQKVCVAKWLRTGPRFLVLDEPTQGVDVGGKQEILGLVRAAAEGGLAVLVCSSDLEDLELVCTRVLVVRRGAIGAELTGSDITREAISTECYRD